MTPVRFVVAAAVVMGCREAPVVLRITVDGVEVARLRSAELGGEGRALVDTLPAEARAVDGWVRWTATSGDGRVLTIDEPAEHYPDHDIVLRLERGAPSVVILRHRRADQPPHLQAALARPEESLAGVATIAIERTAAAPPAATAKPPATLQIVRGGQAQVLGNDVLARLPALPDTGHKRGGWELRDVLGAAGVPAAARVTAVGREGRQSFGRADLDAPGVRSTLRRNRRGELRLSIERDGAAPIVVHDLRTLELPEEGSLFHSPTGSSRP